MDAPFLVVYGGITGFRRGKMGRLGKQLNIDSTRSEGYLGYFSTLDKVWQQLEDAGACGVEGTHLLTEAGYSEYADSVALAGEVLGKVRSTGLGLETGILARFKSYKDVLEDRLGIEYQAHQQAVEKEVFETLERVTGKNMPLPPSNERFIDPEDEDAQAGDESVDEVENSIFDEGVVPEEEIKGIKEIEGIEEIEALRPESAKDVSKGIQGNSEADYSDEEPEEEEEGFDYDDEDEPEEELDYSDDDEEEPDDDEEELDYGDEDETEGELDYGDDDEEELDYGDEDETEGELDYGDDEPTPEGGIKKSSKADVLNVQKGRKLNEPLIKDKRHIRGIPGHEVEDAFFDGAEKLLGRLGL